MSNYNPECCGAHCHGDKEVRVLPLSKNPDHGNLIYCHACYLYEMGWRRQENRRLGTFAQYLLPDWAALVLFKDSHGNPP